jgi:ribosomal-protein-alanine N-acetyltransferase
MTKQVIILQTERLILRRLQPADIPALIDLWCDPDVTQHLGGPRDKAKLEKLFAQDAKNPFAEQYDLWPLFKKSSDQVIGHCGLLEKEVDGTDEIEVIYILKASEWGKGYATEIAKAIIDYAFVKRKLERLIALIEPENAASEHVAVKIGMKLEKEVIRPGGAKRKVYTIQRS